MAYYIPQPEKVWDISPVSPTKLRPCNIAAVFNSVLQAICEVNKTHTPFYILTVLFEDTVCKRGDLFSH